MSRRWAGQPNYGGIVAAVDVVGPITAAVAALLLLPLLPPLLFHPHPPIRRCFPPHPPIHHLPRRRHPGCVRDESGEPVIAQRLLGPLTCGIALDKPIDQ